MLPKDLLADLRHVHLGKTLHVMSLLDPGPASISFGGHHRRGFPCGQLIPAPEVSRLATAHLLALSLEVLPHGQADAGQDVLLLLELLVAQVQILQSIDGEGRFKLLHLSSKGVHDSTHLARNGIGLRGQGSLHRGLRVEGWWRLLGDASLQVHLATATTA